MIPLWSQLNACYGVPVGRGHGLHYQDMTVTSIHFLESLVISKWSNLSPRFYNKIVIHNCGCILPEMSCLMMQQLRRYPNNGHIVMLCIFSPTPTTPCDFHPKHIVLCGFHHAFLSHLQCLPCSTAQSLATDYVKIEWIWPRIHWIKTLLIVKVSVIFLSNSKVQKYEAFI